MGVLGRVPGTGGARVNGEYIGPGVRRYGSEIPIAGVSKVGVQGAVPVVAHALKNVGLLKRPGEMGILWGKMNLVSETPFVVTCE